MYSEEQLRFIRTTLKDFALFMGYSNFYKAEDDPTSFFAYESGEIEQEEYQFTSERYQVVNSNTLAAVGEKSATVKTSLAAIGKKATPAAKTFEFTKDQGKMLRQESLDPKMLLLTVQQKESFCATPLKPTDRSKLVVKSLTSSGNNSDDASNGLNYPSCPVVNVAPFTTKSCDDRSDRSNRSSRSILKKETAVYSRKYSSNSENNLSNDDSRSLCERPESREPSASLFQTNMTPLNASSISDKVLRIVHNKNLAELLED